MSNAEKAEEPGARCPSPTPCSKESENDGTNAENAESIPVDGEQPNGPSWCLIDHPEIWMKPTLLIPKEGGEGEEELKDVILRSERLKALALMNKPRPMNEITSLPDAKTIADHFSCAICNEIPFPWKGSPDILLETEEGEKVPFAETVYLCDQGHVVCRACAQSFGACTFSKSDITQSEEVEDCDSDTDQYQPDTLVEESMSMDSWGQSRLCLASIDLSSRDVVLAKLIEDSEFACQYFYNWCSFRGRGKALQDHERNCEFKESPPIPNAECSGEATEKECEKSQTQKKKKSDDDSAILSFNLSAAISKADDLIGEILDKHLSSIDLSYISPHVLKNHISGCDEQDSSMQLTFEKNQNETLEPEIAHQDENASESGPR